MAGKGLRGIAAAITTVIVLATAPAAVAFVPRADSTFFGVSSPNFFVMNQRGQDALLSSYLSHIQATGAGWVRDAVPWPDAERLPPVAGNHTYRWADLDSQISRIAQHDLTLQPIIRQTPPWAESAEALADSRCGRNGMTSKSGVADYGAFVGAYLRRYGRGGTFWSANPSLPYRPVERVELWNEPNWYPFACPGPDPERYAQMVAAAADAAHDVDPDVTVSIGGLVALKSDRYSKDPQTGVVTQTGTEVGEFLSRMTSAVPGLPGKVDAVAIHLYDQDPDGDISLIGWLRSKMAAAELRHESILVTEYGWRTNGDPQAGAVAEGLRARFETIFANQAPRLNCDVIGSPPTPGSPPSRTQTTRRTGGVSPTPTTARRIRRDRRMPTRWRCSRAPATHRPRGRRFRSAINPCPTRTSIASQTKTTTIRSIRIAGAVPASRRAIRRRPRLGGTHPESRTPSSAP
jgi:hypothetical protein